MQEIWKDIYFIEKGVVWDYRGFYAVSNFGNVKSLGNGNSNNSREKILKPNKTKSGYLLVMLYKNGKRKSFLIHRLVLFMFNSDSYFDGAEINHIDENKENNSISNLEWCTREYNNNYGTHNKKLRKVRGRKVIGFSLIEMKIIILQSTQQAKKFGFDQAHICSCCNNKSKSHKGYKWYYLEEYRNRDK